MAVESTWLQLDKPVASLTVDELLVEMKATAIVDGGSVPWPRRNRTRACTGALAA
jgi:hypothetical protein